MAFSNKRMFVVCIVAGLTAAGCQSVRVVKNPDEFDGGIRFYRPKPYLLVTPADPTGRLVNLKLEYLPDFNEEYSAHLKGKASLALKDGWNLVGVNTKEAAPKEEAPPKEAPAPQALPTAVVAATNVPIGYYESVFEVMGSQKYIKGWRYIGFTVLGGGAPAVCHRPNCPNKFPDGCVNGPLFGLVTFNGVMTFRQIDEVANNELCPSFVDPAPGRNPAPTAPGPGPEVRPGETPSGKPTVAPGSAPAAGASVQPGTAPAPDLKPVDEHPTGPAGAPTVTPNMPKPPSPSIPPTASRVSGVALRQIVENLPPLPDELDH